MIKVVNRSIRTQKPGACIINIMRPGVLGNPFIIGKDREVTVMKPPYGGTYNGSSDFP